MPEEKKVNLPKWKVFESSYENAPHEEKKLVVGFILYAPSWKQLTKEQRRLWMEHKKDIL